MSQIPTPSGEIRPSVSLAWTLEPESPRVFAKLPDGRLVHVATVADCQDADDQNAVAAALAILPALLDLARAVVALEDLPDGLAAARRSVVKGANRILAIADGSSAPPCLESGEGTPTPEGPDGVLASPSAGRVRSLRRSIRCRECSRGGTLGEFSHEGGIQCPDCGSRRVEVSP